MASGGNTWFKIKRAKLRAQDVARACGANNRFAVTDNGKAGRAHSVEPRALPAKLDGCEVKVLEPATWVGSQHSMNEKLYRREGRDQGARARVAGVRTGMRGRGVVVQVVDTAWEIVVRR